MEEDSSPDGGTGRVKAASKSIISVNDVVTVFLEEDSGAGGRTGRVDWASKSIIP